MNYSKELKMVEFTKTQHHPLPALEELNNKDAKTQLFNLFKLLAENNNTSDLKINENVNTFTIRMIFCFFFESTDKLNGFTVSDFLKELLKNRTDNFEPLINEFFVEFNYKSRLGNHGFIKNSLFEEYYPLPNLNVEILTQLLTLKEINWKQVDFNIIYEAFANFNQNNIESTIKFIERNEILNILNVLFLNKFNEQIEAYPHSFTYLAKLRRKLASIRLFDPNCNCGQYLIVGYEELCNLELKIIDKLCQLGKTAHIQLIKTTQLFGLEKHNTNYLLARLCLSIVDYKIQLKRKLNKTITKLDFSYNASTIIKTDGLTTDWNKFCPAEGHLIYVISNFYETDEYEVNNNLCQDRWLIKIANYINDTHAETCFLFKDSIRLNKENSLSWRYIFERRVHINFIYSPFDRKGFNEKGVIVGLSIRYANCYIYSIDGVEISKKEVKIITPSFNDIIKLNPAISLLPDNYPACSTGVPVESGRYLLLTEKEKNQLITKEPRAVNWIKRLIGTDEFNETLHNWCLSYENIPYRNLNNLKRVKELMYGIKVQKQKGIKQFDHMVNIFSLGTPIVPKEGFSIIIPEESLKNRSYFPVGYYKSENIISKTFVIHNASLYMFGIFSSSMFNEWAQLLSDEEEYIHFSIKGFYESFPWPTPTPEQISLVESVAEEILYVRESFPHFNIRNLYGLTTMPIELLDAHIKLDRIVETIFSPLGFNLPFNKRQILSYMYDKLISERL